MIEKFSFHQFDTVQGSVKKIDPRLQIRQETREMQINNMLSAASNNDMVLLTRYIEIGVDFNMADYDNRTALHLAVCNGHLNVVKFLLTKGRARVNPLDRWNSTPLDEAIRYDFAEVREYVEKRGGLRGCTLIEQATVQY